MSASPANLDALVDVVLEDVQQGLQRIEDRTANRCREIGASAEEHVEELERAGRELGRVRGAAAESSFQRAADVEISDVLDGAFDRLADRFLLRVKTALDGLRNTDRYADTLVGWAGSAAAAMDGPADVFCAPEDRPALYDALLAAGATDFQVHADRDTRVGFVVRDLDGRTLIDRRPEAIVEANALPLRTLLKAHVPDAPSAAGLEEGSDAGEAPTSP